MNTNFMITKINRVIFIGQKEYPQKRVRFSGELNNNELIYHFSGKSTVYFNGKVLEIEKDTIRFLPKGENREYIVEKEEYGECIDIYFDTDLPVSDEAFVMKTLNDANIGNIFKKIFSLWVSKNDGYYFECISLLYKVFAMMQKQNYIPENQYDLIKPAISHIEENFLGSKISIPYLAELCQISEVYLKKLFIKKFSVSPMRYIIQLKINHACDLLLSKQFSITQVAELCGYDNVYFFSRQFKKYVGVTPSVFVCKYKSSK